MAAPGQLRKLTGTRVSQVVRRAKWILLHLDTGGTLAVHLGMTGRLGVYPANHPLLPHTHIRLELDTPTPAELRFADARRFGEFRLLAAPQLAALLDPKRIGPEPWELTEAEFSRRLARTKRTLKAALMDQKLVAGLGNIYAEELCHLVGVHPGKRADRTTASERARLLAEMTALLDRAILARGTSVHTFLGADDEPGDFQALLRVYDRDGQPCLACGTAIKLSFEIVPGRSTRWCPRCQPGRPRR
jgi:formamidopyrimidine-DNA glycosylase